MATKKIKAWIDGAVQEIEVEDMTSPELAPTIDNRLESLENSVTRISEVTLLASAWTGDASPYSQVVEIDGVTEYSQVDLKPSVEQLDVFHNKDIGFVTENEDGVVTVYLIGKKPENDYTMQVSVTEVNV
jgi:acylphosphatase